MTNARDQCVTKADCIGLQLYSEAITAMVLFSITPATFCFSTLICSVLAVRSNLSRHLERNLLP
jgi:hypothetical protein